MPELEVPSSDLNVELTQGGVKAAMAETGAKSRDLLMVPIDKLTVVAGLNVRIHDGEYEAHIEEVKHSIIENGFYLNHPISGYAGKEGDTNFIYVTGGFTRLLAAKRAAAEGAGIEALPVVLKPPGTSMLDLTFAMAMDQTGSPLKPYERAIVMKRAIGYGADEETIAKKMNVSSQYVKDLLYLMGLPNGLQQQVIHGRAAAGHVVQLARKVGPAEALKAFEASAVADPLSTAAPAGRVTPAQTRVQAKGPIIAKKMLFNAIDYAIALPGDGIKWLMLWRKADADAVAELAAYKPPRKNAKKPKAKAIKKGAKVKDAFDTGTGDNTEL